jgi:hypothetical protein
MTNPLSNPARSSHQLDSNLNLQTLRDLMPRILLAKTPLLTSRYEKFFSSSTARKIQANSFPLDAKGNLVVSLEKNLEKARLMLDLTDPSKLKMLVCVSCDLRDFEDSFLRGKDDSTTIPLTELSLAPLRRHAYETSETCLGHTLLDGLMLAKSGLISKNGEPKFTVCKGCARALSRGIYIISSFIVANLSFPPITPCIFVF